MRVHFEAPALPLAIGLYAALALVVAPSTFSFMIGSYVGQALMLAILLIAGLPIAALLLSPRAPAAFMLALLRERGVRLGVVVVLFCLGLAAFSTFKTAIPRVVPFYADPVLADLDAFIHGGNPGEVVHMLVPRWAQYPLANLYGPIWFVLWFGLMAVVALHPDRRFRQRYFWAMALTVAGLGTAAATALSSVGPVFYAEFFGSDRFAPLMAAVAGSAAGEYMQIASGYLLGSYRTGASVTGGGISAMPSMHLAVVTLNALMLGRLDRRAGLMGWLYVGLILVGSVYLGWHYAIDGYASIAAVALIWWLTGRIFASRPASAPASVSATPVSAG